MNLATPGRMYEKTRVIAPQRSDSAAELWIDVNAGYKRRNNLGKIGPMPDAQHAGGAVPLWNLVL